MKYIINIIIGLVVPVLVISCSDSQITMSGLDTKKFVTNYGNKTTGLYVLKSKDMEVCITNYGGRIVSIMVPDKDGIMRDVVLGFSSINDYLDNPSSLGATIGRVANRIKSGNFTLDDKKYSLPKNSAGHCIHGGYQGFQYKMFDVKVINENRLVMTYVSPDGEEGFPGNLKCEITMLLTDDNSIDISYRATTDKPTVVNMTNHSFFNLDGDASVDINDYQLWVNADCYTPIDSTLITTGEIVPVSNTPLDFTKPERIGDIIDSDYQQLNFAKGIDHNFVLNHYGDISKESAKVYSEKTGIMLSVYTNEPGLQVYTSNSLDGKFKGKGNIFYHSRCGICLETQHYPDSPNKIHWPSVVLRPGEEYYSRCIYKFSVINN